MRSNATPDNANPEETAATRKKPVTEEEPVRGLRPIAQDALSSPIGTFAFESSSDHTRSTISDS